MFTLPESWLSQAPYSKLSSKYFLDVIPGMLQLLYIFIYLFEHSQWWFFGNEVSFVHQVFLLYGYTIFAVSNKVGHKYYSHLVWKRRMLLILNQFYHKVTTRWPDFNLCCCMDGEISLHPLLSWELCVKVLFCKGVSQILQPSTRNLDVDAMWKGLCKESHTLINLIFLSNV